MSVGKNVAIMGARVALGAAFGGFGNIAGGAMSAFGNPVVLSVLLEVMDQKKEAQILDKQAQVFAYLSKDLDTRGVVGLRNRYGDVVSRDDFWNLFTSFASPGRVGRFSEKWNITDSAGLGSKMFSTFAETEYGAKDLPAAYVQDV